MLGENLMEGAWFWRAPIQSSVCTAQDMYSTGGTECFSRTLVAIQYGHVSNLTFVLCAPH